MSTNTYAVTGMSCGHCENAVREEVEQLDGVRVTHVSAAEGSLVVENPHDISDVDIIAAVDEAGYTATRTS